MIKSVEVMNKAQVENYGLNSHTHDSVVISISSRGCNTAFIVPNSINQIKEVLKLQFNDTDSPEKVFGGIGRAEVKAISDFVKKYEDSDKKVKLIINCEAGQSRSAGVAAAIMKYLYNDDTPIFNNSKYTPNMLCYNKLLYSLMLVGE